MLPTMSKSPGSDPTHFGNVATGATGAFASTLAMLHAPASNVGPYGYDCVPFAEHALIHTLCAEFVKLTNGTAPPSNVPQSDLPAHAQNAYAWHQLRSAIGFESFDVPGKPPAGVNVVPVERALRRLRNRAAIDRREERAVLRDRDLGRVDARVRIDLHHRRPATRRARLGRRFRVRIRRGVRQRFARSVGARFVRDVGALARPSRCSRPP